jgi:hypothetical protein
MLMWGSIQRLLVACTVANGLQANAPQVSSPETRTFRSVSGDNLELMMSMTTLEVHPNGPELAYELDYRNISETRIVDLVIQNTIPTSTQYRVGSSTAGRPPASIRGVQLLYSADGGITWDYRPVSGGGGAPPNYDARVTHVRFSMTGNLLPGVASEHGVGFSVRVATD